MVKKIEPDELSWMANNLKINDKAGELVPLVPNIAQLKVHNTVELQRTRNLPMRVIIVKARQEGVSTYFAGKIFGAVNRSANKVGQIVSADLDSTNEIFGMSRLFQAEIPKAIRRQTEYSNKKEIVYTAPHRSRIMVQTAGKDVLGRGGRRHYFLGSEVSVWPDAKEGLGGALQQIPKHENTLVALESTGHGVGGEFYDRYVQAVDKLAYSPDDYSGFLPIFLAWHSFPEYRVEIPGSYYFKLYEEHEKYGDEIGLQLKYNLSKEQLYWRRLTIESECGGDLSLFMQEYPADWQEAFQTTGQSVFLQSMLNRWRQRAKPGRTVIFQNGNTFCDIDKLINSWQIWNLPELGHEYAHGIDTCEGKVSNLKNERSKTDYDGAVIYDRHTNAIAAQYFGRTDQHELGKQVLWASQFYNNAWTAPELPHGMVVLDVLKQADYKNIFNRQIHEERYDRLESRDLGWRTTLQTRPQMVQDLINLCREDEPTVYSPELIKQMQTFIRDKTGKPTHIPGEHDDLVFAFMIALQLHLRCPLNPIPYEHSHTSSNFQMPATYDLARMGAIDPGLFGEDEGDWDEYTE